MKRHQVRKTASIAAIIALGALVSGWTIIKITTPTVTVSHTVQAGETLWQIAQQEMPSQDPRKTIYEIERMNPGVKPGAIFPGQVLKVPVRGREQ